MLKTYLATYSIDVIALLFLYVILHNSNMLNDYRKKPFLFAIVLTVIIIASEAGTILASDGSNELRNLNIISNILGFALTPIIPIVLIAIFNFKVLQIYKFLLLPTLINIAAAILSPFFKLIFYVDVNNHYERGKFFFIFVMVYILNLLFLAVHTLRTSKMYHYPNRAKMIALSFFTISGTSIQLIVPSVYSTWHCVTLSLLLYFLLLSEFDSSFDPLTKLYSRATFEKAVKRLTSRKGFSVIILDINDFKSINDTYGHDYGDVVLKAVAAVIRKSLDSRYACYRYGGDEFYIIGRETQQEKIEYQLKCMTNDLDKERRNDSCLPTISYGYSIFQGDQPLDFQRILKVADEQMYYYKKLQKSNALQAIGISQQSTDLTLADPTE